MLIRVTVTTHLPVLSAHRKLLATARLGVPHRPSLPRDAGTGTTRLRSQAASIEMHTAVEEEAQAEAVATVEQEMDSGEMESTSQDLPTSVSSASCSVF